MATRELEVGVREHAGAMVIDLRGDVNSGAEEALTGGYARATEGGAQTVALELRRRRVHQQHRDRPDRGPARAGPGAGNRDQGVRPVGPLPGDLRDHPPGRLHDHRRHRRRRRERRGRKRRCLRQLPASRSAQAGDGVQVIEIKGDITAASEDVLMDAYGRANEAGARSVVLDFTGLEYMNSGGIGLLVTMLVRAQRQRQAVLRLRALGPLPADLRADPPRRGGRDPRHRGRGAGCGRVRRSREARSDTDAS